MERTIGVHFILMRESSPTASALNRFGSRVGEGTMRRDLDWLIGLQSMGMRPGLETTSAMLSRLGMPQMRFPSIHVAGSNGKGSVCAVLANAHTISGIRTGLFTSPHLSFVEERIRVDGVPVDSFDFDTVLRRIREACVDGPPIEVTFFEATFLAAMLIFADEGVERAIIETGLGGRLDATRCCVADACVLTDIALEHTDILGDDLAKIAAEKAAIARPGVPLIARWSYDADVRAAIEAAVVDKSKGYWWRSDRLALVRFDRADKPFRPLPGLKGFDGTPPMRDDAYLLARATLKAMDAKKPLRTVEIARRFTRWPGRLQIVEGPHNTSLLLDCAHNPSGMQRMAEELLHRADEAEERGSEYVPEVLLIGATVQSDLMSFIHPILEIVVHTGVAHVVVTEPSSGRNPPIRAERLKASLHQQMPTLHVDVVRGPVEALQHACNLAASIADVITKEPPLIRVVPANEEPDGNRPKGFVWAFGSLYLVGDLISSLEGSTREAMEILQPMEWELGEGGSGESE